MEALQMRPETAMLISLYEKNGKDIRSALKAYTESLSMEDPILVEFLNWLDENEK